MAKFRKRVKSVVKQKRGPKIQSAASNTSNRKYRDLAKIGLIAPMKDGVTAAALQKLDTLHSGSTLDLTKQLSAFSFKNESDNEEDATSVATSIDTVDTFASKYSQCSNVSYSKFYSIFRPDNKLHKEMWAILEAITEVIKESGGSESNTDYHCAMLTTLEKVLDEDEESSQLRAILSLLYMGLKKVPEPVLRKSFASASKMLITILRKCVNESSDAVTIKASLGILCGFLKVQDSAVWNLISTSEIFNVILNPFCFHPKPKLRKASQDAVIALIKDNYCVQDNFPNKPADIIAEFCKKHFMRKDGTVPAVTQKDQTSLHILGFLKRSIVYFSKSNIEVSCKILLNLLMANDEIVTLMVFDILQTLFSHQTAIVSALVNGRIISALYDFQPALQDPNLMSAWLIVLQHAHSHLADVDLNAACIALPILFKKFLDFWLYDKIVSSVTQTIENLVRDIIQPATETPELIKQHKSRLTECFNVINAGLSFKYEKVWPQVLHNMRVLFEVAGKNCSELLQNCLVTLGGMYDICKFKRELEFTVGAAVRSMGPSIVLKVMPFKTSNGEFNLERSWLILVIRENTRGATLSCWYEQIYPLAIFCDSRSNALAGLGENAGAHSYSLLKFQLWNLLPSFCNKPTDIKETFPKIKKLLHDQLSDSDLVSGILASLRKLITSAKESESAVDLSIIQKTCKNYIPALLNIYAEEVEGTDKEGIRKSAFETARVFLSIASSNYTAELFEISINQIEGVNSDFKKECLLDIIRILVVYQNEDSISKLYENFVNRLIFEKNHTQQKKAYKLLEEILKNEFEGCQNFIKNNRKTIKTLLHKTLETTAGPCKGSRIKCFYYLLKADPRFTPESKLLKMIISEAVVCCKDVNMKCRTDARLLLNHIGENFIQLDQTDKFIALILQGLIDKTEIISATVLSLTSILHNFSGGLGFNNIEFILENISELVKVPNREIVTSCLDFIKMYCMTLPTPTVGTSLSKIMRIIVNLSDDCKNHSRVKIRHIITKLLRKFGVESLLTYIPTTEVNLIKVLRNIRKSEARKKKLREIERQQGGESESEDEFTIKGKPKSIEEILADSDDEDENDQPKMSKADKKKSNTWIEEDIDDITDFTDPKVARRIISMKPQSAQTEESKPQKEKDINRGFKTDSQGRIIIKDIFDNDEDDNDDDDKINFEDSDDEDKSEATEILTGKKRKRSETGSTRSAFSRKGSVISEPPAKYKPGGSGIHRPMGSEYKSKKGLGDIKKKGKLDPYAYIPLQRHTLNKRNRGKIMKITKKAGKRKRQ